MLTSKTTRYRCTLCNPQLPLFLFLFFFHLLSLFYPPFPFAVDHILQQHRSIISFFLHTQFLFHIQFFFVFRFSFFSFFFSSYSTNVSLFFLNLSSILYLPSPPYPFHLPVIMYFIYATRTRSYINTRTHVKSTYCECRE